jgi:hypothetical protein
VSIDIRAAIRLALAVPSLRTVKLLTSPACGPSGLKRPCFFDLVRVSLCD